MALALGDVLILILIAARTRRQFCCRPRDGEKRCLPNTPQAPFSASGRPRLKASLSMFTGQRREDMDALLTGESIYYTSNGLMELLDALSHEAFDLYLFGLECYD
ncbi:hypothetical protein V1506DRAFT_537414 [Lipomyces tetrasporus]